MTNSDKRLQTILARAGQDVKGMEKDVNKSWQRSHIRALPGGKAALKFAARKRDEKRQAN